VKNEDQGDPDPDAGDPTGGDKPDETGGDKPADKEEPKFTQQQVNDLLAREIGKKTRGKLDPSELGFASRKELEEFLSKAKEKTEAEKTDAEKAIEVASKAAADEATKTVLGEANSRLLLAEFKLGCAEFGIPKDRAIDAFNVVKNDPELWEGVAVSDKGVVEGLDEDFFESLEKSKPWFFQKDETTDGGGSGDIGAGAGGRGSKGNREAELKERYSALR
jgi:hypothetical protein